MLDAVKANHMAILGDYSIGTTFPLSLVMHADKTMPRTIGQDRTATFTIGKVELSVRDAFLQTLLRSESPHTSMFYGRWDYSVEPKIVKNEIEAVEHRWVPEEDHQQGFEFVGPLSDMFSTFYKVATQNEGRVAKLRLDVNPGSFGRLIPEDFTGDNLPLWRVRLQPSEPKAKAD